MSKDNNRINKARYWTAVLYPENMVEDWEILIGDIVQYPYAYCLHNADIDSKSEHRKDHVHIILAMPNSTTYKHAKNIFDLLSAEGKQALNKCEAVVSIRSAYDYLIHDTETCRKQGKHLYDVSERITGNNFDIGAYEQLSTVEKNEMFVKLGQAIKENNFCNYMDFYDFVIEEFVSKDVNYIEVLKSNSGHFERLTKGNFQRQIQLENVQFSCSSQDNCTQNCTEKSTLECPECGSKNIIKSGKTAGNTQRFKCKDCGKWFTI